MSITLQNLMDYATRMGWGDTSDTGLWLLQVRINSTLKSLVALRPWPSYLRLGALQTRVPYSTGTITLTNDSAEVTGSATAFTAAMIGQRLLAAGESKEYAIASVTDATTLTLDEAYMGTGGAGLSYAINFVRYATPTRMLKAGRLYHRSLGWLQEDYDLANFLARRLQMRQTATGPDTYWVLPETFYIDPAPTVADQIHFPYIVGPSPLRAQGDLCDWPDLIDWLLWSGVALAVRERNEQDAQAILFTEEFQRLASRAFAQCRPSMTPIQAGSRESGVSWQRWAGQFNITDAGT